MKRKKKKKSKIFSCQTRIKRKLTLFYASTELISLFITIDSQLICCYKNSNSESDAVRAPRQMEVQPAIPFAIQPTFGAYYTPEMGYNNNIPPAVSLSRIFLAFGTATVTVTSTSTSTSKLTAACSSTTSFSTCTS
jgi:hypothetical protein